MVPTIKGETPTEPSEARRGASGLRPEGAQIFKRKNF